MANPFTPASYTDRPGFITAASYPSTGSVFECQTEPAPNVPTLNAASFRAFSSAPHVSAVNGEEDQVREIRGKVRRARKTDLLDLAVVGEVALHRENFRVCWNC